jgi:hypothetical protein
VTTLTANGFTAYPAGDVFNVGSSGAPATLDYDVSGSTEGVIFIVTNQMATAINITVGLQAGDYPPANLAGKGTYTSAALAQNAVGIYGPFESAQFIESANHAGGSKAGKITLILTPASGTLAATVICLKVPKP